MNDSSVMLRSDSIRQKNQANIEELLNEEWIRFFKERLDTI